MKENPANSMDGGMDALSFLSAGEKILVTRVIKILFKIQERASVTSCMGHSEKDAGTKTLK